MSIVRGIRFVSEKYARNFAYVPDTEEKIEPFIIIETQDIETDIVSDGFPEAINLVAKIIPQKNFPKISAERIRNSINLGKCSVYEIATNICSKITLQFENSGEYLLNNEWHKFFKKSFEKYKLSFQSDDNTVFEKSFLFHDKDISEKVTLRTCHSSSSEKDIYVAYPCGGFYNYGAHPREIESCIFQLLESNRHTSINVFPLSAFKSKFGFDASADKDMNTSRFIGVKNFSENQKLSLYDELYKGNCKITLEAPTEKETYKSNSLFHISGTDLIQINFIKE